jgi:hypothetical protein
MVSDDFDPKRVLRVLEKREVNYVLIGGIGNAFYGSPYPTFDIDICPDPGWDNLERLAAALLELGAQEWDPRKEAAVPRDWSAEMLAGDDLWILVTDAGPLDLVFLPGGTSGYGELVLNKVIFDLDGQKIPVASLEDIIRSKEAAGRPKDVAHLPALRRLQELRDRQQGRSGPLP